jgi:Domain of unknown function (DUF4160)
MPTLIRINGFRFFFYSNENNEPPHVHIEKGEGNAKVWLEPFEPVYFYNFTSKEETYILDQVAINIEHFKKLWNEYFNK